MPVLLASLGRALGSAIRAARGAAMPRATTVTVVGDPDSALLASAAALRRLGARITRYDVDDASLEARHGESGALVLVVARALATDTSALEIRMDGASARRLCRRFRIELGRATDEASA